MLQDLVVNLPPIQPKSLKKMQFKWKRDEKVLHLDVNQVKETVQTVIKKLVPEWPVERLKQALYTLEIAASSVERLVSISAKLSFQIHPIKDAALLANKAQV